MLAARNLQNMHVKTPGSFNVPDLLKHDYIFITKQGLIDMETVIEQRHANYFRNRKVATERSIERA